MQFPTAPLKSWGLSGKPSVVYFYGADEAPSCTKQAAAFDGSLDEFSLHGGCDVLDPDEIKWSANFWLWNKPYQFNQKHRPAQTNTLKAQWL